MRPRPENPLIVAIDVSEMAPAVALAEALAPHAAMLKVGLELFWARGPEAVRAIGRAGAGLRRLQAARHPDHGRACEREHREARGADVQRACARRRGDDAGSAARVRGGAADAAGYPVPLVLGGNRPVVTRR